tara:strand:- start:97 stop:426 length:330 start_codon:yes stop_codon:yes gene_type:complete
MELEGEVSIYLDEVLSASMELEVESLAEVLRDEWNFVDDYNIREVIREELEKAEPNNNFVRINDLRTIIREEIAATLSAAINHTNRDRMTMSQWAREEKGMIDGRESVR